MAAPPADVVVDARYRWRRTLEAESLNAICTFGAMAAGAALSGEWRLWPSDFTTRSRQPWPALLATGVALAVVRQAAFIAKTLLVLSTSALSMGIVQSVFRVTSVASGILLLGESLSGISTNLIMLAIGLACYQWGQCRRGLDGAANARLIISQVHVAGAT